MIKVLRAPQLDSWRGIVTAYLLIFMRIAPDGLIDNGGRPLLRRWNWRQQFHNSGNSQRPLISGLSTFSRLWFYEQLKWRRYLDASAVSGFGVRNRMNDKNTICLKVWECRKERIYEQKMSDVIVVYFSNEQNLKFLVTLSISSRFYLKNSCRCIE